MLREDGRQFNELRPVHITRNYLKHPEGSVLIESGDTKVICTVSIEEKVPPFLKGMGEGWLTAEYSLLPRSTNTRNSREAARGKQTGRTQEIQRLIGRSLRSVVDLKNIGEITVMIDCDVIQADGGTRTAAITGSFVALVDALSKFYTDSEKPFPVKDFLAAISIGVLDEGPTLDLAYNEDSRAIVDMNLVMTGSGQFVEVQGTGEQRSFSREEFETMLGLGQHGIYQLIQLQKEVLGELANLVGK